MKKYFQLLVAVSLLSCAEQDFSIDNLFEHANRNVQERSGIYQLDYNYWMAQYLMAYIRKYYEQPKDIEFLIKAFDKSENIELVREVYALQYQLMLEYKNDLKLYCNDSITAIFYKRIKPSNIVAITGYTEPDFDDYEREQFIYKYYDKDGYVLGNEDLTLRYKQERHTIIQKYDELNWIHSDVASALPFIPKYKVFLIEYTPNQGLICLDNKRPIDVDSSPYFKEIEQWLKTTCEKEGYSRMIIPSPIPN